MRDPVPTNRLIPNPFDLKPGATYEHWKGGLYQLVDIGRNAETLEVMVVYRSLSDGSVWFHRYDGFVAIIGGKRRFAELPAEGITDDTDPV